MLFKEMTGSLSRNAAESVRSPLRFRSNAVSLFTESKSKPKKKPEGKR
jgi:hypothetical protein